jgi:hypothetical protein
MWSVPGHRGGRIPRFEDRSHQPVTAPSSGARLPAGSLAPDQVRTAERPRCGPGYTPRSATRRPEAMAAVNAWKSRSFWSAYADAKSAIAFSNTSDPPR